MRHSQLITVYISIAFRILYMALANKTTFRSTVHVYGLVLIGLELKFT